MNVEPETTYLRLPLVFEETLTGILWIWSKSLTEADLSVMGTFAQQVASALKRAHLFQEVQSLALTDPLTGLQIGAASSSWAELNSHDHNVWTVPSAV